MKKLAFLSAFIYAALFAGVAFSEDAIFSDSFEDSIQIKNKNIVVVFGTDWCGHCQNLKRDKNRINFDDYVVCFVDADERRDLARKNSISSYPTSVIFYNGKEVIRKKGYNKKDYQKWIDENRRN